MCGGWRQSRGAASSTGPETAASDLRGTSARCVRVALQQVHRDEPDLPACAPASHGRGERTAWPRRRRRHPRGRRFAVDLAARISGLARPGQVLMSSWVADRRAAAPRNGASSSPSSGAPRQPIPVKGFERRCRSAKPVSRVWRHSSAGGDEKATPRGSRIAVTRRRNGARRHRVGDRAGAAVAYLMGRARGSFVIRLPTVPTPQARTQDSKSIAVLPFST